MQRALLLASLSLFGTLPIAVAATCIQPPAGMASWWSGNGSAADSVGPNNGVVMGGAAFAPGEVGEAFSFDGVSGWVDIPNSASLNPTGPFSVEAWIKANPQQLTAGGIFLIVDKSHGFADGTGWVLQGNADGTLGFAYGIGGLSSPANFPEVNTRASVLDDQWHHLAGVFTGTQLQIYLDGALQNTLNQTALPVKNQRDAEIGRSWGGGTPTRYFHGLIDEVSFYDRAISSNEVAAIYVAGSAGKCAGAMPPTILTQPASQTATVGTNVTFSVTASGSPPLGHQWRFNDTNLASATNATLTLANVQLSQAGNYSVLVSNAAGFVLSSNALLTVSPAPSNCVPAPASMVAWWTGNSDASDVFGVSNGSLQAGAAIAAGLVAGAFDLPSGGYVSVPDNPALAPTNTITVETWIYQRSQLGANDPVVKKAGDPGTTSDGYSLEFAGTGLVAFWVYVGSGGWQSTGSGPAAANQWTHLAGSYDGVTLSLYVNGVLANSRAVTGTMTPSHNPLNIGGDPSTPSRHFDGLIDEVSVYNRALSGGDIASIYVAGAAGKCVGATRPTILTQPASQTVTAGTNVTFRVTASGLPPLSYQWQFNSATLASATNGTLTLANVQLSQAGDYSVLVSNAAGFILSSNALLIVNPAPSNCVPAPAGLVSWWSGNGSAADSVGPKNGVVMGGAAFAPGEVGEAFSFDGVSGWVDIPNSASLNPIGPFSVEAWIKANPQQLTAGGIFLIVDKSHGFADGTGWVLQGNADGTVGFAYGIGGISSPASFPEVNTLASVLDNQWHHIAGVFTGTQLQIYLDGGLQSTLNQTVLPVNNQRDAEIGRSWGGGTPTRYFHGLIDEVSCYDRGLSSNEVAAIYAAGSAGKCSAAPVIQTGLRADYRFQNSLLSSVGNPPALSNLGSNAFVTATVDGASRTALAFGFNDGVLLQPGTSVIPSNVYSVVILAALDDVSYYRRLLGFPAVATDEGWYVHNGRLSYWPVVDGSSEAVAAGEFHQFALTRAADGTVRGYVEGVLQAEFPDADGSAGPGTNGLLRFFQDNATDASAGLVARIRIYDIALAEAQVAALDRLPPAGPILVLSRAGELMTVSWPTNYTGYRLRSAPSLTPPVSWNIVNNVSVSGPVFQATVSATNNSGFFQLVKP